MPWKNQYEPKITTAEKAVRAIKDHHRVFLTGNCSVPQTLLDALGQRAPALGAVEVCQLLALAGDEYAAPQMAPHLRINSLFISANVRPAVNEGRADFTPVFLGEVPHLFSRGILPIDVALIQVSPPDDHGYCSFGIEVGVTKTAADAAKIIIAEVNPKMPRTLGDSFIHVSKLDYVVEVDYELPEIQMGGNDEVADQIAQHIAALIPDGACLQTGIGAIPDSVLKYLSNHKDLGLHTELFSDGVIDLVEQGVMTCARKTFHPGKMIAGFMLGTRRLYDFVHDNPIVELHPTEYVNDPFNIAQNDNQVAINSAIEIDVTGQVCADSIGTRFYSGVGGQVDFVRGASRSKGGLPIIALASTAKGGTVSRIVPTLRPGAGVVTTRNDVHYVVTEYGVANLYGRSVRERAKALIDIAHPDFREELAEEAEKLYHFPKHFVPATSCPE
ncbi:MAG: acetyl-CoA hydrolase/transferase family protein [Chloroflexi bacterium]|nr:acetyl-CoA hydrolase/transferase family protein [Chloroflexota bacterium]